MRHLAFLLLLLLAAPQKRAELPEKVEFAKHVQPIFQRRCQPCHFPGGTMHAKLPFDRAETIVKLDAKLFTRIKAADEQAVIRRFLAQSK